MIYTKTSIEAGKKSTLATKPNNNSSNPWWELVPDTVLRGLAREGDSMYCCAGYLDLRNFVPWFQVGDIVPVIQMDGDFYIDQTLTFCGSAANCSIRWNETEGRMMAVYK